MPVNPIDPQADYHTEHERALKTVCQNPLFSDPRYAATHASGQALRASQLVNGSDGVQGTPEDAIRSLVLCAALCRTAAVRLLELENA